ncbi:MAG: hypothetical protein KDK39_02755 [Leptospiraceae bacterium]|nr:hypothetical protein [Leptospiraceae bacterium]
MAVTKEQKQLFNTKVRPYKSQSEDLKKEISMLKAAARKNNKLEAYFHIKSAVLGIQRANLQVTMSKLSYAIQSLKNDTYLSEARKELNQHINDLSRLAGETLDGGLTDNKDNLPKFAAVSVQQRLNLLRGFFDSIENVKNTMGTSSKWRWSFPDTFRRLLILGRNLLDFKDYERTKDPNNENYRPYQEYMQTLMEISQVTAQEFRQKYELSTSDAGDLQQTEKVFSFQKQVYLFTGQKDELQRSTNALDNVKSMLETLQAEKSGKKKKVKRKK